MKHRLAVIGAGLCGSLLSAALRRRFQVTVIEQGRRARPLFNGVQCDTGEVTSSINRGEGLGGTTNYWHNALIELSDGDLVKAGIAARALAPYYTRAWRLFLADGELSACAAVRDSNRRQVEGRPDSATIAHMVFPRSRANLWRLADERHPGEGEPRQVVYGQAQRIVPGSGDRPGHVVVATKRGHTAIEADSFLCCAGGLSTPALVARSLSDQETFCGGYHDHPMAYVAKVRLRPDSRLKAISCTTTAASEVRAGLVYEVDGVKTAVYLRPALDLRLQSIRGPARFILSDLRNDPLSIRKIGALLANPEAVREAVLFKTRSGFRGDYYSLLLLGEQLPLPTRGLSLRKGEAPTLNWLVTDRERAAYAAGLRRFCTQFSDDIVEINALDPVEWEFRTAAHHSGAAAGFTQGDPALGLDFFAARGLRSTYICDGSLLRAGGIANSGLTLLALSYRLADGLLSADPSASMRGD